jgi:ribonuclease HI
MIEIYFDGACESVNPGGTASFGYIIKKNDGVMAQGSGVVGSGEGMTNNIGEYHGLIEGIKAFLNLNIKEKVIIYGDSDIVCKVVAKKWGWNKKKTKWEPHKKAPHLKPFLEKVQNLLKDVEYEIKWIKREDNRQADELSKKPLIDAGIIKAESEKENCPKCNGYLVKRNGKFGSFYGCSNYPKCKFIKPIK